MHDTYQRDEQQREVLRLDPHRHARVLGAPGSGKTAMLVESAVRFLEHEGWADGELLVLASNRRIAAKLRDEIDRGVARAHSGRVARTAVSFAQSLLRQQAERAGLPIPRLITGLTDDQILSEVIAAHPEWRFGLPAEAEIGVPIRTELRDVWRVVDEYGHDPASMLQLLQSEGAHAESSPFSLGFGRATRLRLEDALRVISCAVPMRAERRPGEYSASGMERAATDLLRASATGAIEVPRLILIDDAGDVGEGTIRLLAACASLGTTVWAFGAPELSTGVFQGERTHLLQGVTVELSRGEGHVQASASRVDEQVVRLDRVYRHNEQFREIVADLAAKVGGLNGSASSAQQAESVIERTIVSSDAALLGTIAHRLRAHALGATGGEHVPWGRMAVFCRHRSASDRIARALAAREIPTAVAAGGNVMRAASIVREIVQLTRHVLGIRALEPSDVWDILQGSVGEMTPIAMKRLLSAVGIAEMRRVAEEGGDATPVRDLVVDAATHRRPEPLIDSAEGRAVQRVGSLIDAAERAAASGASAREVVWELWAGTGLAERWQNASLATVRGTAAGAIADEANRNLDAMLALFFTLQRHEEQGDPRSIAELFTDVLTQPLPEDTLTNAAPTSHVTVTTPHGVVGQEFDVVIIADLQDGIWPNLQPRGSLLGAGALERWLRGDEADLATRYETMQDELRLYVLAMSRACQDLLVIAVRNEEAHESVFWRFGSLVEREDLSSTPLTLRGLTAEMRRRLTLQPDDDEARATLAALAAEGVAGACPDEWFGVQPTSTDAPLVDLSLGEKVHVSPSQIERAEACPLDWFISFLGAAARSTNMQVGTLIHDAMEQGDREPSEIAARVREHWGELAFEAPWQDAQWWQLVQEMAEGLAAYLTAAEASEYTLVGRETRFRVTLDRAELHGIADRIEARIDESGVHLRVVDLKTGSTKPTNAQVQEHAQLLAYQLGVLRGAFGIAIEGEAPERTLADGAELLFVHPKARGTKPYVKQTQAPLSEHDARAFAARVEDAARLMAGNTFTAEVQHHCNDVHAHGACTLHIVGEVSAA